MSTISTTETVRSADWASEWFNSKLKSHPTKGQAGYAPIPKEFVVQAGILDIVGTPDADSKIQIVSSVRGQSETVYYEQAITADNMSDSWTFSSIKGNEFQVKLYLGAMTSCKLAADYNVIF